MRVRLLSDLSVVLRKIFYNRSDLQFLTFMNNNNIRRYVMQIETPNPCLVRVFFLTNQTTISTHKTTAY